MKFLPKLAERKISVILGIFFKDITGDVSGPLALIVPDGTGSWCRIRADGMGCAVADPNPFDTLYFDQAIGYSFVAPLIIVAKGRLDGSETITSVDFKTNINLTELVLNLDCNLMINVRFEDDEIFLRFDACGAT
jgi:hypothetical protein